MEKIYKTMRKYRRRLCGGGDRSCLRRLAAGIGRHRQWGGASEEKNGNYVLISVGNWRRCGRKGRTTGPYPLRSGAKLFPGRTRSVGRKAVMESE